MVKRRTVLALAAGAAVVGAGAAARASLGAGPRSRLTALGAPDPSLAVRPDPTGSPGSLVAQREFVGGRLRVDQTAFDLSHLGVAWQGARAEIRTHQAGRWSGWQNLDACHAGSALLVVPGATAYEVRVDDPGAARILELNTVDSGPSADAAAVASSMPMPDGSSCPVPYLSRSAWGADESKRFKNGSEYWPPVHYRVQTLTVHHSASSNNDPDPAATIRAVYHHQSINLDWGDIGYHLLIDDAGRVYQGRWSGGSLPVFRGPVTPGFPPLAAEGAHVLGFNPANVGICLLGTFTSGLPTSAAEQSLVRVLASLAGVTGLNPLATTTYRNGENGKSARVGVIGGHRDYAATACPGDALYSRLTTVRQSVAPLVVLPEEVPSTPRKPDGPSSTTTPTPPIRRPNR